MTRFKLSPWLAISAMLLIGPMALTAPAAIQASTSEDGLQYLPMDSPPASLDALNSGRLSTSAVGEVTVAQYGLADFLVANRGRFLAVRFDLPFDAPYTIASLSFPSRVQIPNSTPGRDFASFRSIRVYGANAAGNLDKTQLYFRQNRYRGSNNGGTNTIPLNLASLSPGTFYAVFEFPTPTSGVADTFPFLYTDLQNTEAGLFANSYASDTAGAVPVPAPVGTMTGSTLLIDQNINAALNCVLSSAAPLNAPTATGMNARSTQFAFETTAPANILADGTAAPNNYLDRMDLVRRDAGWVTVASAGAGSGKISLTSLGAGVEIWAMRAVDKAGHSSVSSNVVISGSTSAVGAGAPLGADADEPNGRMNETEGTALAVPASDRPGTIWPAGDEDNFWFYARPGDDISASVTPVSIDFRNDLDAVIELVDNSGDVLATASSPAPGEAASLSFHVPAHGGSSALRRHFVHVVDRAGSALDPLGAPHVLVPGSYNLSVDVQTPAALRQIGPSDAPLSALLNADDFAFVNAGANPVRGNATFGFVIPRSSSAGASVKLRIYDVRGRMVTTLVNGTRSAGTHYASWSGHDSRGNRVASGPYFARLDAGSWSRVVRVDLVK